MVMAFTCPAGRLHWLLIGPLVLQSALPAAGMEAAAEGLDRSAETLLAQAPRTAAAGIPKEVQGWFDAAEAAAAKGDSAEALRLQKQVVEWVQANRPPLDVFRARALISLGNFLSGVGQRQDALAPTEEALKTIASWRRPTRPSWAIWPVP
jgi:tetratricopeptide (TPR) repeat protein